MVFNVNRHYLVSNQSYAKQKYFHMFHQCSNLVDDSLMRMSMINEVCLKVKHTKS